MLKLLSARSDMDLWNAASRNNREAFSLMFQRHYSFLYQYGRKICPDCQTIEDCIQELFTDIWQRKPHQQVHSVRAYLLQALKFKIYKVYRSQKRLLYIEDKYGPFEVSCENFVVDQDENLEKTQKVLGAINSLPARQKEVIYLKIYKGLSYEEVSEVMQINYQAVRNLLCHALKSFRKLAASA